MNHMASVSRAQAEALLQQHRYADAEPVWRAIVAADPQDVQAVVNLAGLLVEICRFADAEQVLLAALHLHAGSAGIWSNLGIACLELQRYDDAVAAFGNALRIKPDHVPALRNLAVTLSRRGDPARAIVFFDLALALVRTPKDLHRIRYDRALAVLASGDYAAGFRDFECRLEMDTRYRQHIPFWDGRAMPNATLLITEDAAFGDMLQFARFLPLAAARVGRLEVRVPAPLHSLVRRLAGVAAVLEPGQDSPTAIACCPIMSLPHLLGTTIETIPSPGGYLAAEPAIEAAWAARVAADGPAAMRVGLVWAGGARPWHREINLWDQRRSMSLEKLHPVLRAAPDALFYSLQIGGPAAEVETLPAGLRVIDHTRHIEDFGDTAGLISQLDLVIAVDTSTAHLAGALGKRVWLLSRFDGCWRWMRNRTSSPWYDRLTIYAQPAPFDWETPIARMVTDLD